jgi:hypothetical protein
MAAVWSVEVVEFRADLIGVGEARADTDLDDAELVEIFKACCQASRAASRSPAA